jgi:hypothetical protein
MKKAIFILLFALIFVGCKTKEQVVSTKTDNKSASKLKGAWTITSVVYPGSDYIKITSFETADSKCFVNSDWNFIPNNDKGDFVLNSASCVVFSSPITWYISKEGDFVMKILKETKARKVTSGYLLKIREQSESSFQLVDQVNVGGKQIEVIYQFQKK